MERGAMTSAFSADENFAKQLDAEDPLRSFREKFHLPLGKDGKPLIYFAGNSLGLMPKSAREIVDQELDDWAKLGVDAHLQAKTPWYTYHEPLREPTARIVGAKPVEVICMNSLTVNLHLLMATFYRPTKSRFKILMEYPAFPSDTYAIKTQIRHHGLDPKDALVLASPRKGEFAVRTEDIVDLIEKNRDSLAIIWLAAVNFFTGQLFDMATITKVAQKHGITVGFDLAHAVGNVQLAMHDWNVDFAVWCSYKYLNAGPGAVAGAYLHERHATNTKLPRLAGWFGNDPNTRFQMQLEPEFIPVPSADAWQVSNPPIFSMAPLLASLSIFDEAGGMEKLRAKSMKLTGYLEFLISNAGSKRYSVITPSDPSARGCQLSILAHEHPKELFKELQTAGVKCDFREPNVIRVAPTPLYNGFHEVWRFAETLGSHK
ncbi:MAG TPA: kynureninase [Chthoniobacterales bacterium]|jgi:kynureninase|nr:kynureninase [Chthoniobacterales bacterium]